MGDPDPGYKFAQVGPGAPGPKKWHVIEGAPKQSSQLKVYFKNGVSGEPVNIIDVSTILLFRKVLLKCHSVQFRSLCHLDHLEIKNVCS
jgi:hypothetical protein